MSTTQEIRQGAEVTAEVIRYDELRSWGTDDRWVVAARLDGQLTDIECSHLHHTPEAAQKCLTKVERKATMIVTTGHLVQLDHLSGAGEVMYEHGTDYDAEHDRAMGTVHRFSLVAEG